MRAKESCQSHLVYPTGPSTTTHCASPHWSQLPDVFRAFTGFHQNPTLASSAVTSYTSQTTGITSVLQKEPEGMEEKLSVAFQVSNFKYLTLSDSFNYYAFNSTTREKKRYLSQKIILGEGGEDGGTLECFIYGKTANYLNKFLY